MITDEVLRSSYFVDRLSLSSVGGCGSFFAKLQGLPWGLVVESEQKTSHTTQRITLRDTSQWCADAAPAEPDKVLAQ